MRPEMCDVCKARAAGMSQNEAFEQYEQNMLDTIHLHGISLTGVYDAEPPFVYSAGRTLLNLPELYMTGYGPVAFFASVINGVHAAQVENGLHVHDGDKLDGFLIDDHKLAVVEIDPAKAEMFATLSLFSDFKVAAFQLVWPDPEDRFPWDDGYSQDSFTQPIHRNTARLN